MASPYTCMADRIVANTVPDEHGDCWLWVGRIGSSGYGRLNVRTPDGKVVTMHAHRVAFETWHRPLAPGETVDHSCRTSVCVNPAHLTACSNAENVRRMHARRVRDKRAGVR